MLKQSRYLFLVGSFLYLVAWLFVLPAIAEFNVAMAILSLSFLTALYCVVVARVSHGVTTRPIVLAKPIAC